MTSVKLTSNAMWLYNELGEIVRLFLGDVPISIEAGELAITHTHERADADEWIERLCLNGGETAIERCARGGDKLIETRSIKRAAKTALFRVLSKRLDARPPWGSLTGIRPTRLMYEALSNGMTLEQARDWLVDTFYVAPEKAELLCEIIDAQTGLVEPPPNSFDLYVSIPFCVTRCDYCSFSAGTIGDGRLVEPYVNALIREINECAREFRRVYGADSPRLRAGYVGGGTPTSISADQLRRVLGAAMSAFPGAVEWTVEAGRPDTIDMEKLKMLKSMGVTRISVNPQTFSDATLKAIGRAHTSADTLNAYALAREAGFDDINMDIIAALPGEDIREFEHTLDTVIELNPESVTAHTLAVKRSSKLHERLTVAGDAHSLINAEGAHGMVNAARRALTGFGYRPYYLYRQKYMAGNLENVGYARPGHACLYNIGNMEETAKVLAVGAGAITKWLFERARRIERAANVRNIEEYIRRADDVIQKKFTMLSGDPDFRQLAGEQTI